jgi:hypothetical protein
MIHWNVVLMHEVCFAIFTLGVIGVWMLFFALISWAIQLGRLIAQRQPFNWQRRKGIMKHLFVDDIEIVKLSTPVTEIDMEDHLRQENRFFKRLREEWTLDEFNESAYVADFLNTVSDFSMGRASLDDIKRVAVRVAERKKRDDAAYCAREEQTEAA